MERLLEMKLDRMPPELRARLFALKEKLLHIFITQYKKRRFMSLMKAFHRWAAVYPVTLKCNELTHQLKERIKLLDGIRKDYLKDVVCVKHHLNRLTKLAIADRESFSRTELVEGLDELHSVPSVDVRKILSDIQKSAVDGSAQMRETLVDAGLLDPIKLQALHPWEKSQSFRRLKRQSHGPSYQYPAIGGESMDLAAPRSHKLYVRYCFDCIGAMSFVKEWNTSVEKAFSDQVEHLHELKRSEAMRNVLSRLHDKLALKQVEICEVENRNKELESAEDWLSRWTEARSFKYLEETVGDLRAQNYSLIGMAKADRESLNYELGVKHASALQEYEREKENLQKLLLIEQLDKEEEIRHRTMIFDQLQATRLEKAGMQFQIERLDKELAIATELKTKAEGKLKTVLVENEALSNIIEKKDAELSSERRNNKRMVEEFKEQITLLEKNYSDIESRCDTLNDMMMEEKRKFEVANDELQQLRTKKQAELVLKRKRQLGLSFSFKSVAIAIRALVHLRRCIDRNDLEGLGELGVKTMKRIVEKKNKQLIYNVQDLSTKVETLTTEERSIRADREELQGTVSKLLEDYQSLRLKDERQRANLIELEKHRKRGESALQKKIEETNQLLEFAAMKHKKELYALFLMAQMQRGLAVDLAKSLLSLRLTIQSYDMERQLFHLNSFESGTNSRSASISAALRHSMSLSKSKLSTRAKEKCKTLLKWFNKAKATALLQTSPLPVVKSFIFRMDGEALRLEFQEYKKQQIVKDNNNETYQTIITGVNDVSESSTSNVQVKSRRAQRRATAASKKSEKKDDRKIADALLNGRLGETVVVSTSEQPEMPLNSFFDEVVNAFDLDRQHTKKIIKETVDDMLQVTDFIGALKNAFNILSNKVEEAEVKTVLHSRRRSLEAQKQENFGEKSFVSARRSPKVGSRGKLQVNSLKSSFVHLLNDDPGSYLSSVLGAIEQAQQAVISEKSGSISAEGAFENASDQDYANTMNASRQNSFGDSNLRKKKSRASMTRGSFSTALSNNNFSVAMDAVPSILSSQKQVHDEYALEQSMLMKEDESIRGGILASIDEVQEEVHSKPERVMDVRSAGWDKKDPITTETPAILTIPKREELLELQQQVNSQQHSNLKILMQLANGNAAASNVSPLISSHQRRPQLTPTTGENSNRPLVQQFEGVSPDSTPKTITEHKIDKAVCIAGFNQLGNIQASLQSTHTNRVSKCSQVETESSFESTQQNLNALKFDNSSVELSKTPQPSALPPQTVEQIKLLVDRVASSEISAKEISSSLPMHDKANMSEEEIESISSTSFKEPMKLFYPSLTSTTDNGKSASNNTLKNVNKPPMTKPDRSTHEQSLPEPRWNIPSSTVKNSKDCQALSQGNTISEELMSLAADYPASNKSPILSANRQDSDATSSLDLHRQMPEVDIVPRSNTFKVSSPINNRIVNPVISISVDDAPPVRETRSMLSADKFEANESTFMQSKSRDDTIFDDNGDDFSDGDYDEDENDIQVAEDLENAKTEAMLLLNTYNKLNKTLKDAEEKSELLNRRLEQLHKQQEAADKREEDFFLERENITADMEKMVEEYNKISRQNAILRSLVEEGYKRQSEEIDRILRDRTEAEAVFFQSLKKVTRSQSCQVDCAVCSIREINQSDFSHKSLHSIDMVGDLRQGIDEEMEGLTLRNAHSRDIQIPGGENQPYPLLDSSRHPHNLPPSSQEYVHADTIRNTMEGSYALNNNLDGLRGETIHPKRPYSAQRCNGQMKSESILLSKAFDDILINNSKPSVTGAMLVNKFSKMKNIPLKNRPMSATLETRFERISRRQDFLKECIDGTNREEIVESMASHSKPNMEILHSFPVKDVTVNRKTQARDIHLHSSTSAAAFLQHGIALILNIDQKVLMFYIALLLQQPKVLPCLERVKLYSESCNPILFSSVLPPIRLIAADAILKADQILEYAVHVVKDGF